MQEPNIFFTFIDHTGNKLLRPFVRADSAKFKYLPRVGDIIDKELFDTDFSNICSFEEGEITDFFGIKEFSVNKIRISYTEDIKNTIISKNAIIEYNIELKAIIPKERIFNQEEEITYNQKCKDLANLWDIRNIAEIQAMELGNIDEKLEKKFNDFAESMGRIQDYYLHK